MDPLGLLGRWRRSSWRRLRFGRGSLRTFAFKPENFLLDPLSFHAQRAPQQPDAGQCGQYQRQDTASPGHSFRPAEQTRQRPAKPSGQYHYRLEQDDCRQDGGQLRLQGNDRLLRRQSLPRILDYQRQTPAGPAPPERPPDDPGRTQSSLRTEFIRACGPDPKRLRVGADSVSMTSKARAPRFDGESALQL